jgi:spermidine synthase
MTTPESLAEPTGRRHVADVEQVRLGQADPARQVWTLYGQRMKHSVVDLNSAAALELDYARLIAALIDVRPDGPLATVHIGGGARTLARYVAATRPGSPQVVVEPNPAVNELAAELPPIAALEHVEVRQTDGRAGLAALGDGTADLIIIDAFADCRVPASITTLEAMVEAARALTDDGLLVLNLLDTRELRYVHRVLDTVQRAFPATAAFADRFISGDRGFGNVVVTAATHPAALPVDDMTDVLEALTIETLDVERSCPHLIAHVLTDAFPEASPVLVW